MPKIGIINVNLCYEIPDGEDAQDYLANIELPSQYVEDSYEFVKVINECGNCGREIEENETRCQRCK